MGKHRQRAQEEQQDQAYYEGQQSAMSEAPPSAPPVSRGLSPDDTARLQELGKLHEQGILTDEEFSRQKAIILGA
jgi:hypothetical protein